MVATDHYLRNESISVPNSPLPFTMRSLACRLFWQNVICGDSAFISVNVSVFCAILYCVFTRN